MVEKNPAAIVLDLDGVGYQVQISSFTYRALPEIGQTLRVLTHFVVREDSQILYGFLTEEERQLFRQLLSVSGIGPKMAITILSGIAIPELKRAIIDGALPVLTAVSGIGRKTAERVIVELREKLVVDERRSSEVSSTLTMRLQDQIVEDSLQALMSLGYPKRVAKEAIQKALRQASTEKISAEEIIRASLKHV